MVKNGKNFDINEKIFKNTQKIKYLVHKFLDEIILHYWAKFQHSLSFYNGLHVKGGRVFDREFTKSLIIHDFDDVLKNPFRYVDLFLLHTLLSKKFPKIAIQDL